ncbi:hypothetical protein [Aliivibrio fischeri]|uniref:hypothetical protein n=1 Tax=Aliivibrio fischeri TaxID=668 RepID=UPI0007C53162|nr:hypothetical protein [Aliivibrio fischeri]MBP3155207.1 hypothetical protein [Aliivibrio fischeri]MCE7575601.1 hypothetical protein [Aliivibrio fischeri]
MTQTGVISNVTISLRGTDKGTDKFMSENCFYHMVSNNLKASFELEGIKQTNDNYLKIKKAANLLKAII